MCAAVLDSLGMPSPRSQSPATPYNHHHSIPRSHEEDTVEDTVDEVEAFSGGYGGSAAQRPHQPSEPPPSAVPSAPGPHITPPSPVSPLGQFTRRVSFNNLHPEWTEPAGSGGGTSVSGGTPWNPSYAPTGSSNYTYLEDPTFGYGTTNVNDISKAYSQQPLKKKLKLPDPPARSILKNKVSQQQSEYNSTVKYDGNESAIDDDFTDNNKTLTGSEASPSISLAVPGAPAQTSRRKSYSEMTNEELMALDPQFQTTKSRTTNMDQFKFDSQKTYYLPANRRGSSTIGSQPPPRQVLYPSSNENNYKSISLTVKHRDFDSLPYNRTILTVLSGRRHTWNSVDWLLRVNKSLEEASFLQDGDYLIISALIPLKFVKEYKKHAKRCTLDEYLYKKCENLISYIVHNQLLETNDLRLKITVEFVTDNDLGRSTSVSGTSSVSGASGSTSAQASNGGSTSHTSSAPHTINPNITGSKYLLQHLFKQYQPNLVVIGNKSSNLNFKYPLKIKKQNEKDEYLIKLSSYVVKYSTVPVILVGNGTNFHNKTGRDAMLAESQPPQQQSLKFDLNQGKEQFDSQKQASKPAFSVTGAEDTPTTKDSSPGLERKSSSTSSADSIESTQSFTGPNPEYNFEEHLSLLAASDEETRFKDMITLISDQSLHDSKYYLVALNSKDDSLKVDSKIHSIYRSQTTGHSVGLTSAASYTGAGNASSSGPNSLYRSPSDDSGSPDLNSSSDRIYKVRSLISYNENNESKNDKLRNNLKNKRNRSSVSSKSTVGSEKDKKEKEKEKEKKGKKSLWQKLGLKK